MSVILGSFLAINSGIIASKAILTKINEQMNDKIISEGLYHVTSKENVDAIIKSKYIRPSNYIISYGRKRCFFFGGIPSPNDLRKNVGNSFSSYEFNALKIDFKKDKDGNNIDKEESLKLLRKYKQRSFNDDAICYNGKCELNDKCFSSVSLVYDFDINHNIVLREKTEAEKINGYVPSEEIVKALNISKSKISNVKTFGSVYKYEVVRPARKIFEIIKEKLTRKPKYPMINSAYKVNNEVAAQQTPKEQTGDGSKFMDELKKSVNDEESIVQTESLPQSNLKEHNKTKKLTR